MRPFCPSRRWGHRTILIRCLGCKTKTEMGHLQPFGAGCPGRGLWKPAKRAVTPQQCPQRWVHASAQP